ncbi:Mucolipin-3 [Bagarius yarrelli]|uniref:Mucolipin-3 n=1 Tax=Bagarius yarrelli TaxID=175774 RepID=A0A556V6U5_BAGYA|nr:Mucolipin-3 [Bagarius yarrelli]
MEIHHLTEDEMAEVKKNLIAERHFDYLRSKKILTREDTEEIGCRSTRGKRAGKLLDLIAENPLECVHVYAMKPVNISDFSLEFKRLLSLNVYMKIKTINLQTIRHDELPDCYNFSVTASVVFDNSVHSGQIKVSLHSNVQLNVCADVQLSGSNAVSHFLVLVLFDSLVIVVCLFSLVLCMRSLNTGMRLLALQRKQLRNLQELELRQLKSCSDVEHLQHNNSRLKQQLVSPCDEDTAALLNDGYTLEEKERLKDEWRIFNQQKQTFERERKNFTEAAIRLGHETQFLNMTPFIERKRPATSNSQSSLSECYTLHPTPTSHSQSSLNAEPEAKLVSTPVSSGRSVSQSSFLTPHSAPVVLPSTAELYRTLQLRPDESTRSYSRRSSSGTETSSSDASAAHALN